MCSTAKIAAACIVRLSRGQAQLLYRIGREIVNLFGRFFRENFLLSAPVSVKRGGKGRKRAGHPPCSHFRSLSLSSNDLASLIESASLASSVRQNSLSAVGAFCETGHCQLPYVAATLVASCLGYFTLRYGHVVTPPWSKLPDGKWFTPYPLKAVVKQPNGDRVLSCSHIFPRSGFFRRYRRGPCSRDCTTFWNPCSG